MKKNVAIIMGIAFALAVGLCIGYNCHSTEMTTEEAVVTLEDAAYDYVLDNTEYVEENIVDFKINEIALDNTYGGHKVWCSWTDKVTGDRISVTVSSKSIGIDL